MPFPFSLPTTSAFPVHAFISSPSHPSLAHSAATSRTVVRAALKRHKRLPRAQRPPHLDSIRNALAAYLPYLLALDAGLSGQRVAGEEVDVVLTHPQLTGLEWRPTLTSARSSLTTFTSARSSLTTFTSARPALTTTPARPGKRQPDRVPCPSFEWEVFFALHTLALTEYLLGARALRPLYAAQTPGEEQRKQIVQAALTHLLNARAVFATLKGRAVGLATSPPAEDISFHVLEGLGALCTAEATLLTVLKDDPYPAVVFQTRNPHDREWMIKAPELKPVRAQLFARLCLDAAAHAASALGTLRGAPRVREDLRRYAADLEKAARAKACRFLGVDADLQGRAGEGIAWLQGAKGILLAGAAAEEVQGAGGARLSLAAFKAHRAARREDKKLAETGSTGESQGVDAGKGEEGRVVESLLVKWERVNATVNVQKVPPASEVMDKMPSGRPFPFQHEWALPVIEESVLEALRAPPSPGLRALEAEDSDGESASASETETLVGPGGFLAEDEAGRSSSAAYY